MPSLCTFVTRQRAIIILVDAIKREYQGDLPVNRALELCWTVGLLLPSGAKLIRRPDGWWLMGYAYDGRDVLEYVERSHLRIHPYKGEILTQEQFEAKLLEFKRPLEMKVRPRPRLQHRSDSSPSKAPAHPPTTIVSPRRLYSVTGKAAGVRPSRTRAGKWERYF